MKHPFRFSIINLGCAKNLVDTEHIIGKIYETASVPIEFYDTPEQKSVEFLIINTCGFIASARKETENILSLYDAMNKKLIIVGCYLAWNNIHFLKTLHHLHLLLPNHAQESISLLFEKHSPFFYLRIPTKQEIFETYLSFQKKKHTKAFLWKSHHTRAFLKEPYKYEFVKIAEGCNQQCSFCTIPMIRGKQQSRTIEDILHEVETMVQNGIQEIQIIAQDTFQYGIDLYGTYSLETLLQKIDALPGEFSYKLYYLYPHKQLIPFLHACKSLTKFIPYFDIPFQHISSSLLQRMHRGYNASDIHAIIETIRQIFPRHFFHTSIIVGFPGETEDDFKELTTFLTTYAFDSVSVFGYHDEPNTKAFVYDNKIPKEEIVKRVKQIDVILEKIYIQKHNERIGKTHTGYIHHIGKNFLFIRNELYAPEIDELDTVPRKNVHSKNIALGKKVTYTL